MTEKAAVRADRNSHGPARAGRATPQHARPAVDALPLAGQAYPAVTVNGQRFRFAQTVFFF